MRSTPAEGPCRRLLLAEDEWLIVDRIERALEGSRYAVAAKAASLLHALRILEADTFDAAILDGDLDGDRTGILAERLRSSKTPFLMLTAYRESDRCLPQGAPFLAKPFSAESLLAALDLLVGTV